MPFVATAAGETGSVCALAMVNWLKALRPAPPVSTTVSWVAMLLASLISAMAPSGSTRTSLCMTGWTNGVANALMMIVANCVLAGLMTPPWPG